MPETYFAQCTDCHVGVEGDAAELEFAERHLNDAVSELESLKDTVRFILMTGDQVTSGTRVEWQRYLQLTRHCTLPRFHLAANHDLWGQDRIVFEDMIGPRRRCVDQGGIRFFLLDEYEEAPTPWGYGWRARLTPGARKMIEEGLENWGRKPVIVVTHAPILKLDSGFVEMWEGSNAQALLDLLKPRHCLALIAGHWHRNLEWQVDGLRVITAGALLGQQYIGTDPHWFAGTRPGYRLFCYDGSALRTCWRDLRAACQSTLVWIGAHHTGGPRPQVKPASLHEPALIRAQALAWKGEIERVEFGVGQHFWFRGHRDMIQVSAWRPMARTWRGLWSEWQTEFDPRGLPEGEYVLVTRAKAKGGKAFKGEDAVPVTVTREPRALPPERMEVMFTLWGKPVLDRAEAR